MAAKRHKFHLLKGYFNTNTCDSLYDYLKDNIKWGEGIKSKNRHTRSAKSYNPEDFIELIIDDFPEVVATISDIIVRFSGRKQWAGLYLNYYKDGNDWTPNHKHPGTTQIVISLGETRTFQYGKKDILSENGDIFIFGSGIHGVAKEPAVKKGRISIALFMIDGHDG